MEFIKISNLFSDLENRSRRLEKILLLRDFLIESKKTVIEPNLVSKNIKIVNEGYLVFDIIAGNFQREIDKRTLAISLKTIFGVLSFLSKKSILEIERLFNRIGDIGKVAVLVLKDFEQSSLVSKKLYFKDIIKSLQDISKISGTNSNKKRKEILSKLFMSATCEVEYKFLARLLIDDLRVGVSSGVLKEACVNAYFPQVIGVHNICSNCYYVNLNLKNCLKCNEKINFKEQKKIAKEKFNIVEIASPDTDVGLSKFDIKNDIDVIKFALRRDKNSQILHTKNPRNIYNVFF